MAVKRLNIELTIDQYEAIATEAADRRQPIVAVIRGLIAELQAKRAKKDARGSDDAFYKRTGSFDGATTLAEEHDRYIYGDK